MTKCGQIVGCPLAVADSFDEIDHYVIIKRKTEAVKGLLGKYVI